jgi:hypothetical protein
MSESPRNFTKMMSVFLMIAVAMIVAILAAIAYGNRRWQAVTRDLRSPLALASQPADTHSVDFGELEGLPAPVQRYFRTVLRAGQPMVIGARIAHSGTFNLAAEGERWKQFGSDQLVVARPPGFDWNARIALLPGVAALAHDAYVGGEGILRVSLLGLVPLVELRDSGPLADGELMRFFAEAAWYPTALLPSQGVRWEAVDPDSAHGTLSDGARQVSLLFRFSADGLIDSVESRSRDRMVAGKSVPTPWRGRFWNYVERDGMLVPLDGEVAWQLPDGPLPYWRGRITRIAYQFAR